MDEYLIFKLAYPCFAVSVLWILKFVLPSFIIDAYIFFACSLLTLALVYYGFSLAKTTYWRIRVLPQNKAVLITGCDSGFGHLLVKRLDSRGYQVFATCLLPDGEGARRLKETCSSRLHIIHVDVTKDEDVTKAFDYVQSNLGKSELWAIVNNAGILGGFAAHWTKLETFKKVLDVNTLGPVRITKTFLPLLQRNKSRVVNVVSLAGRISLPYLTAYTMSKFAAAAFNDCLRQELQPWGIRVISIEPEGYKTGLARLDVIKENIDDIDQNLDKTLISDYSDAYFQEFLESVKTITNILSDKPEKVVDRMEDAITLQQPNDVYQPCRSALVYCIMQIGQCLPRPALDLFASLVMYVIGAPNPKKTQFLNTRKMLNDER